MMAIIFDLDGTLVDSAPGILASLEQAFANCGIRPNAPLTSTLIGPPLRETLARLCDRACDGATLDRLTAAFKGHYDSVGYWETQPFDGVTPMLHALADAGVVLHIATIKRAVPARLILDRLGWTALFARIYALDTFDPPLAHKAALLARLLADAGLKAGDCAYVGDRTEDWQAARANRLQFFWATWGFGADSDAMGGDVNVLDTPDAGQLLSPT